MTDATATLFGMSLSHPGIVCFLRKFFKKKLNEKDVSPRNLNGN